jgi:S-methyl-1-thioxylulose 5-phosphate methylthiotransferase
MGVIHRQSASAGGLRWDGVALEGYEAARATSKQVLIGPREGADRFAVRYFEIAPGGASALDEHAHDHGVVVLTGRGRVRLGDAWHEIRAGDAVYVAPDEVHQFENTDAAPLGFLCVVAAKRPA